MVIYAVNLILLKCNFKQSFKYNPCDGGISVQLQAHLFSEICFIISFSLVLSSDFFFFSSALSQALDQKNQFKIISKEVQGSPFSGELLHQKSYIHEGRPVLYISDQQKKTSTLKITELTYLAVIVHSHSLHVFIALFEVQCSILTTLSQVISSPFQLWITS